MDLILAEIFVGLPDAAEMVRTALRLAVAALCGAVIGLQREQLGKPAGLRTHMLVALGSTLFVAAGAETGMGADSLARVMQGLIAGIGFLGAGAILKLDKERDITGLTTAAGIWVTAAIGVCAGLGRFGMAFLATALCWIVLALIGRLEQTMGSDGDAPHR